MYKINKISSADYFSSCPSSILDDISSSTDYSSIFFYEIRFKKDRYVFSNPMEALDLGYAPFFLEINDILFVAFYDRVYGLSLNTGKIRYAMDLEFALVGVEKYDNQFYIITDGNITRVLCSSNPEMCYTFHHGRTLNEGGFVVDYKRINDKILKLIYEDGSIAEYNLYDSTYIYPSSL